MNPVTLLNAIVGSYAEGERKKMFGADYKEKQALQRAQAAKTLSSIPLDEQRAATEAELAQHQIKDYERKAREAAMDTQAEVEGARLEQSNLGPQDPDAPPVAEDDLIAKSRAVRAAQDRALKIAGAKRDITSAEERSPNFVPDLTAGARRELGIGDEPTNLASISVAQRAAEARHTAQNRHESGSYQPYVDPNGELYAWNAKSGGVKRVPVPGSTRPGAALPPGTQDQLSGMQTSLQSIGVIERQMQDLKSDASFGPLVGRLMNVSINKIGGAGSSPEEQELGIRMRALVRDTAFGAGGKQLTPTEKEEFTATLPGFPDTLGQAFIKVRLSREFVQRTLDNRLRGFSPSQQNLIDPRLRGGGSPASAVVPDFIVIGGKLQPNPAKRQP